LAILPILFGILGSIIYLIFWRDEFLQMQPNSVAIVWLTINFVAVATLFTGGANNWFTSAAADDCPAPSLNSTRGTVANLIRRLLAPLSGPEWRLYFVQKGVGLEYALHNKGGWALLGILHSKFCDNGERISDDWELHISYYTRGKEEDFQLTEDMFRSQFTHLTAKCRDIDKNFDNEAGWNPMFVHVPSRKVLPPGLPAVAFSPARPKTRNRCHAPVESEKPGAIASKAGEPGLRESLTSAAGGLPDQSQFAVLKRLFPGKRFARHDEFDKQHLVPLRDFMREEGITMDDAGEYLYASHAPERNDKVGQMYEPTHQFARARTDSSVVGASGMSTDEARAALARYQRGPKAAAFAELGRRVT
jgi:hypothetical protein